MYQSKKATNSYASRSRPLPLPLRRFSFVPGGKFGADDKRMVGLSEGTIVVLLLFVAVANILSLIALEVMINRLIPNWVVILGVRVSK